MARIVLIPRMPENMALDFIFLTQAGIAVQVSDEELQALRAQNIPVLELYASGNEYAIAVHGLNKEQALAALTLAGNTALAALTPAERSQFGVA